MQTYAASHLFKNDADCAANYFQKEHQMPKLTPLQSRFSAACQALNIPCTPEHLAALAQAAKPPKEPSVLDKMTEAILQVCKWTAAMWGRASRTAKKLIALGLTAADILLHYGPQDPGAGVWWWWRKGTDWRNKTLIAEHIAETCGQWEGRKIEPRASAPMPEASQSTLVQAQWLLAQQGMGD